MCSGTCGVQGLAFTLVPMSPVPEFQCVVNLGGTVALAQLSEAARVCQETRDDGSGVQSSSVSMDGVNMYYLLTTTIA